MIFLNIENAYSNMVLYAQDIMKKYTNMLPGELSALEGAKIMSNDHVGFVIVQKNGNPVGIVTEWDYISKVVSNGVDPAKITLREIMGEKMVSVTPDTPTVKVTRTMNEHSIRRLPVIDNGKLVGVITSRDIIRIFKDYMESLSEIIEKFGVF